MLTRLSQAPLKPHIFLSREILTLISCCVWGEGFKGSGFRVKFDGPGPFSRGLGLFGSAAAVSRFGPHLLFYYFWSSKELIIVYPLIVPNRAVAKNTPRPYPSGHGSSIPETANHRIPKVPRPETPNLKCLETLSPKLTKPQTPQALDPEPSNTKASPKPMNAKHP